MCIVIYANAYDRAIMKLHVSATGNPSTHVKETKSATKNIFRKKYFLFKSFVKAELS